jgi:hypothetical protein
MIAYEIETRETCTIKCNVEGHHVAAALDSLLGAQRADNALRVPHLVEDLIVLIATMKPLAVIKAAADGGCMPGMVLEALMSIKHRALYWHKKAVRHEKAELERQAALDERREREKKAEEGRAHGDVDQATESRPDLPSPLPVKRTRARKKSKPKVG